MNPDCDPGEQAAGEGKLASYLAEFLKRLGAKVSLQEVLPGRPNVIAVWEAASDAPHLVFAPHTDTVGVKGMTIDPFRPVRKNGRIYGRGAADTKGPMAAVLWALQMWSNQKGKIRDRLRVSFVGLMGEEAGNEGAIALVQGGFQARLVVVCEPTDLQVVYAHKGALWFKLRAIGKACHGSTPERGVNAIEHMAFLLPQFKKDLLQALSQRASPLGAATLNFGIIQGGRAINIVPDCCEVSCDLRFPASWKAQEIWQLVRRYINQSSFRAKAELIRKAPGLATRADDLWIRMLAKAGRGLTTAPWFCDAAIFGEKKIPSVAFGPGSIAQAHTAEEFILERQLQSGARAYWSFLQSVAQLSGQDVE